MGKIFVFYSLLVVIVPALSFHVKEISSYSSQLNNFIDTIMILFSVGGLFFSLQNGNNKKRTITQLIILAVFFLFPQIYLSALNRSQNWFLILRFCLIYLSFYVIPQNISFQKRDLILLSACFCLYGFFCCAYQLHKTPDIITVNTPEIITSIFEHRNRFSAYLVLWMILCNICYRKSDHRYRKLWWIPTSIFLMFLIFTESRASILMAGVYFVIDGILNSKNKKQLYYSLFDIFLVFCILLFIPAVRQKIYSTIGISRGLSSRPDIWRESWKYYIEGNIFLGRGLGTQIEKMMTERLRMNVSTHNAFLYVLNSGGIMMASFYVVSFYSLLKNCKDRKTLLPIIVSVAVYSLFELSCTPFDFWHLSNMFTLVIFSVPSMVKRNN